MSQSKSTYAASEESVSESENFVIGEVMRDVARGLGLEAFVLRSECLRFGGFRGW